ncbi:MAG: ribosome maturation factor RimP [Actinomycetes bacterium]
MSAVADRVQRVLSPVLAASGYDLEALEVQPAGRRRLLKVVVDRDGGVDLDAVATISRDLSAALDASDAMGDQAYVLEVTSPGVDRPLTQPRHWRRARSRLVSVTLRDHSTIQGRVSDSDELTATVVDDGGVHQIPYAEVQQAHVEVEFRRPDPIEGE